MGSSHHLQISKIVGMLLQLQPTSVLDIGTGFGKYGVLAREYLDPTKEKGVKIDGIEGHASYVSALHNFVYDHVYTGDIAQVITEINNHYDLALFIDVLEHFEKENGKEVLQQILAKSDGLIVSTPKYVGVQEDEANEFQEHKSQWSKSDLASLGDHFFIPDPISHLVYIGPADKVSQLKSEWSKTDLRYKIGSVGPINWLYRKLWWNKRNAI